MDKKELAESRRRIKEDWKMKFKIGDEINFRNRCQDGGYNKVTDIREYEPNLFGYKNEYRDSYGRWWLETNLIHHEEWRQNCEKYKS